MSTADAEGGAQIVAAAGELDLSTAPDLCLAVQRAAARERRPRIVIDLRAIEFTRLHRAPCGHLQRA